MVRAINRTEFQGVEGNWVDQPVGLWLNTIQYFFVLVKDRCNFAYNNQTF